MYLPRQAYLQFEEDFASQTRTRSNMLQQFKAEL
jgi:hypothetical protein